MAERVPFRTPAERAAARERVARHLSEGGLLVYPTETVYGIGGRLEPAPLRSLVAFKGPRPFLVLVRSAETLMGVRWTPAARALADRFWPGPLTLALDADGRWPAEVVGPDGAVAVRVSPHAAVDALLDAAGARLSSTSANAPGEPPAAEPDARLEAVADAAGALLLDGGRLPPAQPSTIVRCGDDNRLIRAGAVPREEIEAVVDLL